MVRLGSERFDLVRQVGEGGSGVVFEARDLETASSVAIKVLHGGSERARERFEREVAVLAQLQHPAIVRYVAHGWAEDGRPYLVMEWLAGQTVDHYRHVRWPIADVLWLARRVTSGLGFAAQQGVIHRDIKPANLFLVNGAVASTKIVDFGLARRMADADRVTHSGLIVGTPMFMSPEQARGESTLDERTDVFSLGSVLYTCLCGAEPFRAHTPLAILAQVCYDEPKPIEESAPHAPARLRRLIEAMLRKQPGERPTWRTIAEQLNEIADARSSAELRLGPVPIHSLRTLEASLSGSFDRVGPISLSRNRRDAQRILAALFVGGLGTLETELDAELMALAANSGMRIERLLDGSRIGLATKQLDAAEQTLVAARCALALRQILPGRARFVVCTGRASVGEQQPLGELFERAATMLSHTPAGSIRVDDSSAALLEARFELEGSAGSERALERERSGGEAPRTLLGQPTPFIGRERELQQLQLVWTECVDDLVARAVLVTGPAGSGKSRLRHELIERLRMAGPRFSLLVGRGDPMRGGTQFGVLAPAIHAWAELGSGDPIELKRSKLTSCVAALVPSAGAPVLAQFLGEMVGIPYPDSASPQLRAARYDHQLMADRMLACWLEWIEALGQCEPVLFCVEDLHWADPASLRFIEAALRSSRDRALMVLALARPELRELYPQLWAERDLMDLRLPKLGARACGRLLETLTGAELAPALQAAMIERADGNPFFLEELVRGWRLPHSDHRLPETILAIVQARLDTLGDESKLLIQAGSIFGQTFRLVAVRALLGDDDLAIDYEGALAMLCQREVLFRSGSPNEQEYVFQHALIREAAYLLQSDEERALGHRLAAGWLERNAAEPGLLADHFERGGVRTSAAHFWARAASRAFDAGSLDETLRCGERALACGVDGDELANLAALLAEASSYSEDDSGAAAWAERARAGLLPGTGGWWRATQVGAVAYARRGAFELDSLVADMVEHASPNQATPEQRLAIAYTVSECLRLMRDDLAERLFALLPPEPSEALAGRPEGCLASARAVEAFRAGNLSAALRFARSALAVQRRAGALRDECDTLGLCGYLLHELGAYEEAEPMFLEQVALGQRIGSARDVCYGQLYLGLIYARQARADEAERALAEAQRGYQLLGASSFQVESMAHLAAVACERAELERARETIERAQQIGPIDPAPRAYLSARAASVALRAGRTSEALAQARSAYEIVRAHGVTEFVAIVTVSYVESLLAAGESQTARDVLSTAAAWLDAQAAKIDDPAARELFLTRVPEHARVRELVAALANGA